MRAGPSVEVTHVAMVKMNIIDPGYKGCEERSGLFQQGVLARV